MNAVPVSVCRAREDFNAKARRSEGAKDHEEQSKIKMKITIKRGPAYKE
jgi:hypothetical protein